jgi:hypothetical protein
MYIPKVGNWDPQWVVTDQPYPGSYQYQQQAPPIASKSRGYHLQFQAGYFTDEDVDKEGKFATTNITCSKTANSIVVNINAIKGNYNNMLPQRNYVLQVHTTIKPSSVMINNKKLSSSRYHYSNEKKGFLVIDCGKFDVHKNVVVTTE